MNAADFAIIMECCQIKLDSNDIVSFSPYSIKDQKRIKAIVQENNLGNLSLESFNAIVKQNAPLYQARKKVQRQQAAKFSDLSPQQVAELPEEEKIRYMELLFPRNQTISELLEVCKNNEENIKACLFNMQFSKDFWNKEKKQAERYANLIAQSPELANNIMNWGNTSLEEKKNTIMKAVEVFEYVYGCAPEVAFYTPEEEKARLRMYGLNEDAHINAAYSLDGKIYFNTVCLQSSDNLFAVSAVFHEGTHYRQDTQSFNNPLIDRIFNCEMTNVIFYEDEVNNRDPAIYKNLYAMLPGETHAYGVQEYMENILMEKMQIEKTRDTAVDKETELVHHKAFSMAKITQGRTN